MLFSFAFCASFFLLYFDICASRETGKGKHLWPKAHTKKHNFRNSYCTWTVSTDTEYMNDVQKCYLDTLWKLRSQNIFFLPFAEQVQTHHELMCNHSSLLSIQMLKSSLGHFVRDKTIALLGDSVMLQQFALLGCMIHVLDLSATNVSETRSSAMNYTLTFEAKNATGSNSPPSVPKAIDYTLSMNKLEDDLICSVYIASTNTTLRHTRLGKIFQNLKHYRPALVFELNRTLSHTDIIVLNQGLHYNKEAPFSLTDKDSYSLEAVVIDTLQVYNESVSKTTSAHTLADLPTVVWRETPPQNFPTNNGWYGPCSVGPCHCVDINATMAQGGAEKETYPATYRNDIVEPYFHKYFDRTKSQRNGTSHIHVLKNDKTKSLNTPALPHILYNTIYDALNAGQASFPIHATLSDCTHMSLDAVLFMNQALFSMII